MTPFPYPPFPYPRPSYESVKSCLISPDELPEGSSFEGRKTLLDLPAARSYMHRGIPLVGRLERLQILWNNTHSLAFGGPVSLGPRLHVRIWRTCWGRLSPNGSEVAFETHIFKKWTCPVSASNTASCKPCVDKSGNPVEYNSLLSSTDEFNNLDSTYKAIRGHKTSLDDWLQETHADY